MNSLEFYIPLKRDQVFLKPTDNRMYCTDLISVDDIEEQSNLVSDLESALEDDYIEIINQRTFDIICSLLNDFKRLKTDSKQRLFDCLILNFNYCTHQFEELNKKNPTALRTIIKIFLFSIDWLIENYIEYLKESSFNIKGGRRNYNRTKRNKSPSVNNNNINSDSYATDNQESESKVHSDIVIKNKPKTKKTKINTKEELLIEKSLESLVSALHKLVNCPLNTIFKNQIIEDEVINIFVKLSFDLLDIQSKSKALKNNSKLKEKNFDFLQNIINNSQQSSSSSSSSNSLILKLTSKIVKLLYDEEQFINNLSEFVINSLNRSSSSSKTLGQKIVNDIVDTITKESNVDSQGLKNVTKFLTNLSEKCPKVIYSNLTSLIAFYDLDSYLVRNTFSELLTNVIILVLTQNLDDLDEETKINYLKSKQNFIEMLFKRIYDKSSFCRKTTLQCFQRLIEANCLDYIYFLKLTEEAFSRLHDEKTSVRKVALQLCSNIIILYPSLLLNQTFYLSHKELENIIKEAENTISLSKEEIKKLKGNKISNNNNINESNKSNKKVKNSKKSKSKKTKMLVEDDNDDSFSNSNNDVEERLEKVNINSQSSELGQDYVDINNENYEAISKLQDKIDSSNKFLQIFKEYKQMVILIDKIADIAKLLLGSKNQSDIVEAISLFVTLKKLNIQSSQEGIRKMLLLIVKPEEKIVKLVVDSYREIYFNMSISPEIQAIMLLDFSKNLSKSEMICLKKLLKTLFNEKRINSRLFREIWVLFLKTPESENIKAKVKTDEEYLNLKQLLVTENRHALILLNIFAEIDISILSNNSELLLKQLMNIISQIPVDWLLVNEALKATTNIYNCKKETSEKCILMITKITISHYGTTDNNWYQAIQELINTIFHLMDNPEEFCKLILIKLCKPILNIKTTGVGGFTQLVNSSGSNNSDDKLSSPEDSILTNEKLSHFLFIIGHVALNLYIFCEKLETTIKKKNDNNVSNKKNKRQSAENEIDQIGGGKEAEIELDLYLLRNTIEDELLYNSLIGKFTPLVIQVAHRIVEIDFTRINMTESEKNVYKVAVLSVTKMMCVSKKFCLEHLDLIINILSSETIPSYIRCNVITAFGDLINRHTNIMQTEIQKLYDNLGSQNPKIVRYSMMVISHLALNDMIKLKGEIVDICLLLESKDQKLTDLVKQFLYELKQKGQNLVYNLIPKALARFNTDFKNIKYEKFQRVVDELISHIEKEKQVEGLLEKLINKLKNNNDTLEWRYVTYCMSLLNYSEKNISRLIDNYLNIKDRVEDDIVITNLLSIFNKVKKGSDKESIEELQKMFMQSLKKQFKDIDDNINDKKLKERVKNKIGKKRGNANRSKSKGKSEEENNSEYGSESASKRSLSPIQANPVKASKLSQKYEGLNLNISKSKSNSKKINNNMIIDDDEDEDNF